MKKILLEAYYQENLGDDLFLKIVIEKYPNVLWYIITYNNKYKHNFIQHYKNVKIIRIPKLVYYLKSKFSFIGKFYVFILTKINLDGIVSVGGSIFIQSANWINLYDERKKLWSQFEKDGKKVFLLGSNFGPYQNENFLQLYKKAFEEVHDICFRDNYSYNLFNDLNNVRLAPDIVLTLKLKKFLKDVKSKTIGISIISLKNRADLKAYEADYLKKMANIIDHFVSDRYKVTLFSFCKYEGDEEAISAVLERIEKMGSNNISTYFYNGDMDEALQIFSSMESIIACRFHSLILAYMLNKPTFPIIYSKKTSDIILDLEIKQEMIDIKKINELNVDQIMENFKNLPNISNKQNKFAQQQFNCLDDYLS